MDRATFQKIIDLNKRENEICEESRSSDYTSDEHNDVSSDLADLLWENRDGLIEIALKGFDQTASAGADLFSTTKAEG